MAKKFIVYGGYVGDITAKHKFWQYVSAYKVARCYRLNPNECILVDDSEKYALRGINVNDYIELFLDLKGRYNLRAILLSRRTPKNYDESYSIIKEYDRIIQKELTDWDSLALVHFVVSNLSSEELRYR